MTQHTYLVLMVLFCGACRFGGPDSNSPVVEVDAGLPEEEPDPVDDADDDSDDNDEASLDARTPDSRTGDARPAPGDAAAGDSAADDSAVGDSAAGDAAVADAATGDSGATDANDATVPRDGATQPRPDASVANCDPPADLACDPVSGEGCLPLMQCLVDPSSSAPATICVFGGVQLGATCTQSALSTDCPPQHTCVMGQCRKYCYCDADCDNGAACADPSGEGSTRFRVCEQS